MSRSPDEFHPLQKIWSLKLKLGILIAVAIGVAVSVSFVGFRLGWPEWLPGVAAIVTAIAMVQILARGMTYPLREMADVASQMSTGDYSRRVSSGGADEVGDLGRAFNKMAEELDSVEQQRREFVANAAHELRTPLTALSVNLENLIDGVSTPDQPTLELMASQTQRLARLVEQLLDLSKLESGSAPFEPTTFDATDLLNRARREASLHSPDLDVVLDVPEGLMITGDPERLDQVVFNLLENAARYSPPGVPVRVTARSVAQGVCIEVSDAGPGIPPEERTRVFERFHRADDDRSRSGGGAGLGLSIARWVVDLHGGSISVEPNEPTGARFVITVPTG